MFDSLFPKEWTTLQRLMWLKTNALARAVYEIVTGNPVSFTAKAAPLRQLSVDFSPKQDLHGYDNPWPAGGGKNKCPTPIEDNVVYRNGSYLFTITFNNGVMTWEITGTASTYFMLKAFTITQDHVGKTYTMSFSSTPEIDMSSTASCLRLWDSATQTRTTLNSRTVTITADMVGQDLCLAFYKSGTGTFVISNCQLEEGQTATSYAPYSNECPISGWSSLTVEQTGKNLFDIDGYRSIDPAWTLQDGVLTSTNNTYKSYISQRFNGSIGTITVSFDYSVTNNREYAFQFFDVTAGSQLWREELRMASTSYTRTSTLTDGHVYEIRIFGYGASSGTATISHIQLELGSFASPYQPYNGRSISINLGSTVYSGYVDMVTGVGEIDYKLINARAVSWSSSGSVVYTHPSDLYTTITEETPTGRKLLYCNIIKYSDNPNLSGGGIGYGGVNNNGNITVLMTSPWATPEEWTAYIANNDVFICYPLATPIPIQLTPQEVQSLAGDNNLWSDANQPLTVTYRSN